MEMARNNGNKADYHFTEGNAHIQHLIPKHLTPVVLQCFLKPLLRVVLGRLDISSFLSKGNQRGMWLKSQIQLSEMNTEHLSAEMPPWQQKLAVVFSSGCSFYIAYVHFQFRTVNFPGQLLLLTWCVKQLLVEISARQSRKPNKNILATAGYHEQSHESFCLVKDSKIFKGCLRKLSVLLLRSAKQTQK